MAKVTVQSLPDYTYTHLLTAGHHSFIADEPGTSGGEDLGPGPYELLLWALGACTSMTLLMYARRKEWPVDEISVHLTHNRVHADDGGDPDSGTSRIDLIKRDISVRGNITEEQKERLLEIAGRCPVHRTLENCPTVEDSIIVGQ